VSSIPNIKRQIIALHSVALIAQINRSGTREDLKLNVQYIP
jgi:hypothetical protein